MKKICFILLSVCFVTLAFAKPKEKKLIPLWISDLNAAYPASEFLRATGTASNQKTAENNALGNIAKFFGAKVKSFTQSVSDYSSVLKDGMLDFSQTDSLINTIEVNSDAEFYCVEFEQCYYDSVKKTYTALAYIDRKKAAEVYRGKIKSLMTEFHKDEKSIQKHSEPLFIALSYHRAILYGSIIELLIENAIILDGPRPEYQEFQSLFSDYKVKFETIKKTITFRTKTNTEWGKSIDAAVNSVLEESGFVYSPKNPMYNINIELSFGEPEILQAGIFVRGSIFCTVSNRDGMVIESYSKDYPRFTHRTQELAYSRAVFKIKEDLEENFLIEYRGFEE